MAAGNVNYDDVLASTLASHSKTLVDNIFKSRVLLWWLTQKNKIEKKSGGHKIVQPLIYAQGSAGSYGETDTVTIAPQEGISGAEFPWRLLQANVTISGLEELKNSGPEAIFDLLEAKVMQAEETLKDKLNVMLYANGTGNSGKDLMGLNGAIRYGEAGDTTFGGIDATDALNPWWRSGRVDYTSVNVDMRKAMVNQMHTASKGNDTTDGIFLPQLAFEAFESQLVPNQRYVNTSAADAGFTSLMVHDCPVYWDFDCPAGTGFGLNSKYIKLIGHKDRWFKQTPFTQGLNVAAGGNGTWLDARYALILAAGNLVVQNRKRQFRMDNVTTFA